MTKRTGGPTTESGKAIARANLLAPAEAALTHGARSRPGMLYHCDRCPGECSMREAGGLCRVEEAYVSGRRHELMALPHLSAVDAPAVGALVWTEVRIMRAERYLAWAGEFNQKKAGEYLPVARALPSLQNSYIKQLTALSLTPAGRKAMAQDAGSTGATLQALIRDLDANRDRHAEDVKDAEFNAEEAEDHAA